MDAIKFLVQGSSPEPYKVQFIKRSDKNLSAYCTCPAGDNGQYCKHRFSILEGSSKGIVSHNLDDLKLIQSWLPGTDVENAMIKMRELELEALRIKKALSLAKKSVAKAMMD